MYSKEVVSSIVVGGTVVLPTDTVYGMVGLAMNQKIVESIYRLKDRDASKPFIILISSVKHLAEFDIEVDGSLRRRLDEYWPGPVSIILPCLSDKHKYLHRGENAIAFRLPSDESLRELIEATGPLVAPSANPEGLPPATTVEEARKYFADKVELYVDGGTLDNSPSKLIRIVDDKVETIRL